MRSHEHIDLRSLELSRAIVAHIDADPERRGLQKARSNCERWLAQQSAPVLLEWRALLAQDWATIRSLLLDEGQEGRRLRQSSPFCGILSRQERWEIYRRYHHEPEAA